MATGIKSFKRESSGEERRGAGPGPDPDSLGPTLSRFEPVNPLTHGFAFEPGQYLTVKVPEPTARDSAPAFRSATHRPFAAAAGHR